MKITEAIFQLNPLIVTIRGDIAYDADEQVISYDRDAAEALVIANAYKEKRAKAYPSIADQLDILYHSGFDAWRSAIQAIKETYPK